MVNSPDNISMTHSNSRPKAISVDMSALRPAACGPMFRPGIEDHAVFPLLATRMDVSKLQQDHAEMDAIIESIEQACLSWCCLVQ